MTILAPPRKFLWVWFVWLLLFYCTCLWLVIGMGYWQTAKEHWPIALAMALGSYAAGATPMGGGTIGFPVLVLCFDMPASLGRDFSFAVQSIGMTSASIFIISRRQPLASALLKGAVAALLFVFERLRLCGRILSGELPGRQSHSASPGYREVEAHVHSVKAADGISTRGFPRGDFS